MEYILYRSDGSLKRGRKIGPQSAWPEWRPQGGGKGIYWEWDILVLLRTECSFYLFIWFWGVSYFICNTYTAPPPPPPKRNQYDSLRLVLHGCLILHN